MAGNDNKIMRRRLANAYLSSVISISPVLLLVGVASLLLVNARGVSDYFKEKMHIGYNEYLRSLRFQYAISLFELGIHSVKNVAILSGFSDPLYFSNAFKKEIGISPKEFIAKLSLKQTES